MPRRPDVPCAGTCGRLIWRGRGALPPGQAMCRQCRSEIPKVPRLPPPSRRRKDPTPRNCRVCRTEFLPGVHQTRQAVCSDQSCQDAARRAKHRAKNYRRRAARRTVDVTADYERGLRLKAKRCPMPGCGVNLTDQPFLPNSKELDHMVPINVGGTHTIGNVRIICRRCNMRRPNDGSDYVGPVTLWAVDHALGDQAGRPAKSDIRVESGSHAA